MPVEHLISCIDGLEQNGLLTYDALLTGIPCFFFGLLILTALFYQDFLLLLFCLGFTPGPEGIDALLYSIHKIKTKNPNVTYLVDPVMGVST